jgi:hypothetical protein
LNPLSWQNDSLLLDPEPTPMNDWLTANKLLSPERKGNNSENLPNLASSRSRWVSFCNKNIPSLNLYSILVRKIDFVRENKSDRILSRFPFKVLTQKEVEIINSNDLLLAEIARDYFYKSINKGIINWRNRIQHYLERGAMPYPLARCVWVLMSREKQPKPSCLLFESLKGN